VTFIQDTLCLHSITSNMGGENTIDFEMTPSFQDAVTDGIDFVADFFVWDDIGIVKNNKRIGEIFGGEFVFEEIGILDVDAVEVFDFVNTAVLCDGTEKEDFIVGKLFLVFFGVLTSIIGLSRTRCPRYV